MNFFKTVLVTLAVAAGAGAQTCDYGLYRPGTVDQLLRRTLFDAHIALLGNREILTGIPSGSLYLMQDSQVLGTMQFRDDVRSGTSSLVLTDAEGQHYFEMRETTYVCPKEHPLGRCQLTEMTTELDQLSMTPPAFALQLDPQNFLHFYKYGREIAGTDWRAQFGQTIAWLQDVMTHPQTARAVVATDAQSRIFYALASDYVIAPYADRLSVFFDGTYWVVMGRVPSDGVYGRVIDRLRATGFPFVNPEMTIDTGSVLPLPPEVLVGSCYER